MKKILVFIFLFCVSWQTGQDVRTSNFPKMKERVSIVPEPNKTWVFILAGQSNMAGRGFVEPADTLVNPHILSIDAEANLIYAKEPLHFYEPGRNGLDCGITFAKTLQKQISTGISILLLPTAIGGSSISQWLGDSLYRGIHLLQNFKEKMTMGKKYGQIKGILWHQGESDANSNSLPMYQKRLETLVNSFREIAQNKKLPVMIGELGTYSKNKENWQAINTAIHAYAATDKYVSIVSTGDLQHRGDSIHFNTEGQRLLGERFAGAWLSPHK